MSSFWKSEICWAGLVKFTARFSNMAGHQRVSGMSPIRANRILYRKPLV